MEESYGGSPESVEEKSSEMEESYGGSPESLHEHSSEMEQSYGDSPESVEEKSSNIPELSGGTPNSEETSSVASDILNNLEDDTDGSTSSIVDSLVKQTGGYGNLNNNLSNTSYDNTDETGESVNSMVLDDLSNTSIEGGRSSGSLDNSEMTEYDEKNFPITKSIFIKLVENLKKTKKIKVSKMNIDCMNKIIEKIKRNSNINNKVLLDFRNVVNNINKSIKKYNYNDTCNMRINKYLMLFMNRL